MGCFNRIHQYDKCNKKGTHSHHASTEPILLMQRGRCPWSLKIHGKMQIAPVTLVKSLVSDGFPATQGNNPLCFQFLLRFWVTGCNWFAEPRMFSRCPALGILVSVCLILCLASPGCERHCAVDRAALVHSSDSAVRQWQATELISQY